jgi:hypothetical protein
MKQQRGVSLGVHQAVERQLRSDRPTTCQRIPIDAAELQLAVGSPDVRA